MSRKQTGRRNTRVLNVRLDNDLDADLIAWLDAQPHGKRSETVRSLMREGLRGGKIREDLAVTVQKAIAEALSNVQILSAQQGVTLDTNELEDEFGVQLDQLLDQFG